MQKNKNSTIDLHNIKQDIFLGFLSENNLKSINNFEISFFGGEPLWLYQPSQQAQICSQCKVSLCFFGQMYCPFNADHCYHRILYFLFCQKCIRQFRCIRQQADQNYKIGGQIKSKVRKICEPKQIQNDQFSKNELIKLVNKIKVQVQEEDAIEEAESEDQDDAMNELKNQLPQQAIKQAEKEGMEEKQIVQQQQKQIDQKDLVFEVYKKAIVQLDDPCILYTDTPVPYNKRTLNPQHFCKCGAKLSLEVQITQRILNMDSNPNSKLLLMDWGSIMVYSCGASCQQSQEQCVVVQYQIDAVSDSDIKKLNQKKKNKKKKQQKSKSKSKSKSKQKEQVGQNKNEEGQDDWSDEPAEQKKEIGQKQKQEAGDWD